VVAESNCVAERRGGEQLEANNQPVSNKMLNSIRFQRLASLLGKGEAREPQAVLQKGWQFLRQITAPRANGRQETFGMVGERMVGRWSEVKWGTPIREGKRRSWPKGVRRTAPGRRQSPRSSDEVP
jgi:hypothetical protein